MANSIKIIQIGMGPLGEMITPYLLEKKNFQILAAVDIDPQKVGQDLGKLCGQASCTVKITDNLDQLLAKDIDVAVITTISKLSTMYPMIEKVVTNNINVVSTCEELSFPWQAQNDLSLKIDALAKKHGVSVLGTGVNPGFLMDFLPIAVTPICRKVEKVKVERIQDASSRRLPFRQKIGAGLSLDAFQQLVATKKLRHVGLTESMQMIASKLGWQLDRTEDKVEAVVADTVISGKDWKVESGMATGVKQIGRGYIGEQEVIILVFQAAVGQKDPKDHIHITGTPELDVIVPGGVHGDIATCAMVANATAAIVTAPAGLRTMADIPPVSCYQ